MACSLSLTAAALAWTALSAIFRRHARALLSVQRCSQCIALVCFALQSPGLRRMPYAKLLSSLRSLPPKASLIAWGWAFIS